MKKLLSSIFILSFIVFMAVSVNATVMTFEDIDLGSDGWEKMSETYGGFTLSWDADAWGWYAANTSVVSAAYADSASSGTQFLYNRGFNSLTVLSDTAFYFNGAYFSYPDNAPYNATNITLYGLDANGVHIEGLEITQSLTSYAYFVEANFEDVFGIEFVTDGGACPKYFAMDDFTYNETYEEEQRCEQVPEPLTVMLLGFALLGLVGLRKRG